MSSERYVGERQALWHLLSELQPLVAAHLGDDALLRHRIDRALKAGDLDSLRHARRVFYNQPDALKRKLVRGIFEGTAAGGELPALLADMSLKPEAGTAKPSQVVVGFDAFPAARDEDVALSVEIGRAHV